jgi:hypothetical protein
MLRRFSWQFGRGRPHRDRETECVLYSMPYLVPRNRVLSLLDALHALQYLVPRAAALAQPSDPYALSSSYTHATHTPCIQTRLGCTRESMPKCACTRIHAHTLMPLTLPVYRTLHTRPHSPPQLITCGHREAAARALRPRILALFPRRSCLDFPFCVPPLPLNLHPPPQSFLPLSASSSAGTCAHGTENLKIAALPSFEASSGGRDRIARRRHPIETHQIS